MSMVSPLERRLLLAIVSLMRDREPYGLPLDHDDAEHHFVSLRDVYEQCYALKPDLSYEIQRRNQRQALRRALGRLHADGWVDALALAWVTVRDQEWLEWQGGGRREHSSSDYARQYGDKTPNWKAITLTDVGIKLAAALERETAR
jgi:hypothetical protein